MGVDIRIGEAILGSPDNYPDCNEHRVVVEKTHGGPVFSGDIYTGDSNERPASYIAWGDFIDRVGLRDFFHDKQTGLFREHPGAFLLLPSHLETVEEAITRFSRKYPNTVPRYVSKDPPENYDLVRLLWLEYWIDRALDSCELPTIYNH